MVNGDNGSHFPHAEKLDELRDKETLLVRSDDESHFPHAVNLNELRDKKQSW